MRKQKKDSQISQLKTIKATQASQSKNMYQETEDYSNILGTYSWSKGPLKVAEQDEEFAEIDRLANELADNP